MEGRKEGRERETLRKKIHPLVHSSMLPTAGTGQAEARSPKLRNLSTPIWDVGILTSVP